MSSSSATPELVQRWHWPEIESDDIGELTNDVEIHFRDLEPDIGITSGPDMGVDANRGEAVLRE